MRIFQYQFSKAWPVQCPGVKPHTDLQMAGDIDLLLHKHIFQIAMATGQDGGDGWEDSYIQGN